MKIAIVDDSAFMRGLIARTLRRVVPDAELHEFADPVEALKLMPALAPEIITLDLLMPGLNGLDFLRRAKRRKLPARIVVISADVQESVKKKCLAAGAHAFVEKPVTVAKLRAAFAGDGSAA
jgi:CheY-like chemotaxis protein